MAFSAWLKSKLIPCLVLLADLMKQTYLSRGESMLIKYLPTSQMSLQAPVEQSAQR